ncbi:hypothetical protein BJ138DRAFT_1135973 [Hygrophoropsis aurantiaca]|uniref:Uncharacterized protein n=1 Tax=Hygrophoropsis aurantiaca TaxID=72124 RepID=A0ACB8AAR4_9AGAM|nr:hypothetical protein BJ138DRAFT_1135973 [Hygrophoropsis aurantiaca]
MPPFYEIAVVRFGQSSSCSRWAIAVVFTPASGHSMVYQISGSPGSYTLEAPQSVTLKAGESGYWGKVPVGRVDQERLHHFSATLANIPIARGDSSWHCHNWVMEGIAALRVEDHFIVDHATQAWINERLT